MSDIKTVLFYGMSGAGKGTQARLLTEYLEKVGTAHFIEVGQMLRDYAATHDTYGSRAVKETIDGGGLVPPVVAAHLWSGEILNKVRADDHIIIDGAARSVPEAELLHNMLTWLKRDVDIIILEVDAKTAHERALARGQGRADDTEEAMQKRLDWFKTKTMPAIDYMREQGARVHTIDGGQTVEEVTADIMQSLGL